MDPVDLANEARTHSLAYDIRHEIRTGKLLMIIGLAAYLFFLIALEYEVVEFNDLVFLLLAVIFASTLRSKKREKLLLKAADTLESKTS